MYIYIYSCRILLSAIFFLARIQYQCIPNLNVFHELLMSVVVLQLFTDRAHLLRIDEYSMMLQHLNSSFSIGFPQSHVNNETPIKTQS